MYIGVISDTHGVFSEEFKTFLSPVDEVWHAGDFGGDLDFVHRISRFKPLIGVYGNCDGQDIRLSYPLCQLFTCEGMKVLMTHIGGYPGHYDLKAKALLDRHKPDIFVCGHSHILRVMRDAQLGTLVVNPGACGIQGWHVYRTALRFKIENGTISDMEVFKLPRQGAVPSV